MKKLQVTINLDMDIPEDCKLVDHPDVRSFDAYTKSARLIFIQSSTN